MVGEERRESEGGKGSTTAGGAKKQRTTSGEGCRIDHINDFTSLRHQRHEQVQYRVRPLQEGAGSV